MKTYQNHSIPKNATSRVIKSIGSAIMSIAKALSHYIERQTPQHKNSDQQKISKELKSSMSSKQQHLHLGHLCQGPP